MERRLPYVKKICIFLLLLNAVSGITVCTADEPSFGSKKIRFQLWTELDSFPGLERKVTDNEAFSKKPKNSYQKEQIEAQKKMALLDFSTERMESLAEFLLEGMIYGWNFDYTPYDKSRKVAEFFEFTQIHPFDPLINKIDYESPEIIGTEKLRCWINTERTDSQYLSLREWNSVTVPKIHGTGSGSLEEDFDGIKKAVENAIKDAVREYFRTVIKNKPKEITGRVLVTGTPEIYIKSGRYYANLDFFMETDKIKEYNSY